MKSMVLSALQTLGSRETPDPVLKNPHDVLLSIQSVGICGSDVHYYVNGRIGDQIVQYPHTLGHECSAIVLETGDEVTRVRPGDRIALDPLVSCHQCDQCAVGRYHTCRNQTFLGCPGQMQGCLSERLIMPESTCYPIPEHMTLNQAALVEPLSIALHAVHQAGDVTGKSIAVLGSGPIGLCVLSVLKTMQPDTIFMTDKLDYRCHTAEMQGTDWTGNPDKIDTTREMLSSDKEGVNIVFECCGQQDALDQAIDLLAPGGRLVIVGIPEVERISFNISELRRREINIYNVRRQNECVQPAIDLIASKTLNLDCLITHHFPFERTAEAFELVHHYRDDVLKAMVLIT